MKAKYQKTIAAHVKKLMTYSKKDLAVMYANLNWVFNAITDSMKVKSTKVKK